MATLTLRILTNSGDITKGSTLSSAELDQNLISLNNQKFEKSGDTITGNITLSGAGLRILGDFSNSTVSNRVMFQTSVLNGNTSVGAIPNGTSGVSGFRAHTSSDPTNSSVLDLAVVNAVDARITSAGLGTGNALPLTFYTGTSERVRIDTSGNVGLGVSPITSWSTSTKKVFQIGAGGFLYGDGTTTDQLVLGANSYFDGTNVRYSTTSTASRIFVGNGTMTFSVAPSGTAGDVVPFVNAMVINNTGTVSLGNNATTGAGLNIHSQNTSWSLFRASATSASYSTFYKGGAATAVGYIGTDGGGISSGGTGDNFGVRAEGELILASGSAVRARFNTTGHFVPEVTNTYDLGSTSLRWRNIYTQDLHLSNGIGDYTVVEGVENLYLVNNKTNKSFKFALIEVDPAEVPEKSKVT